MDRLPTRIYRAAQVREMDRTAIEACEIPGFTLMSRAGLAAFEALKAHWPAARRILVLCGAGNNAGDGYVVARLASRAGYQVTTVALFDPDRLGGDAKLAWDMYRGAGDRPVAWKPELAAAADVVVDAMLGTGLTRPLEGLLLEVVSTLNRIGKPVLAVDIPSGLNADTGQPMGDAVRAVVTVTFVGLKLGLFTGQGPAFAGRIEFDALGIPQEAVDGIVHTCERICESDVRAALPPRRATAHKGDHGRLLVVGGGKGMPGAVRLAAEAALRAGAGLVTVCTLPEHLPAVAAGRPELMVRGIDDGVSLDPLMQHADLIAVGPGLGQDEWAAEVLAAVLASGKPLVVDADALNLLATRPHSRDDWILTPHPGEAARLCGHDVTAADVQRDRLAAAAAVLDRFGGVVVLKGAGTIVGQRGRPPAVCDRGNPGMAAPGMGDALTGIIAAVAAQGVALFAAARAGVYVHARAGDDAASNGQRGIVASDLFRHVVRHVNA